MTITPAVCPQLRARLATLARRVRLRRVARGLSATVLTAALGLLLFFALDVLFFFSLLGLQIGASVIGATVLALAVRAVLVPACRQIDTLALAGLIEERHPELAERLTSTLEPVEGSAALIDLLHHETLDRTAELDFLKAIPERPSGMLAGAAAAAVGSVLALGILSEDFVHFGQQLLSPGHGLDTYEVEAAVSEGVVTHGQAVRITARLDAPRRLREAPECFLVLTDESGESRRLAMKADGALKYSLDVESVKADFAFHVAAGDSKSPPAEVIAVDVIPLDAVELDGQSPRLDIRPPAYVSSELHPAQSTVGRTERSALEYSAIQLRLGFKRAPWQAVLRVKPSFDLPAGSPVGVRLSADFLAAMLAWERALPLSGTGHATRLSLPYLPPGKYHLSVTAEADHRQATSEHDLGALAVWADRPPEFTDLPRSFQSGERDAAPDDVLHLKVGVRDDVGLDGAMLEYRVNDRPVESIIIFSAGGVKEHTRDFRFSLKGKVKDGDLLRYRVRATDNRRILKHTSADAQGKRLPETDLTPHVIFEPQLSREKDAWTEIRIVKQAGPLQEKEILAQHDALRQKIEAIKKKLERERGDLKTARPILFQQDNLSAEHAQLMEAIHQLNRQIGKELLGLSAQAEKNELLGGLADLARDISDTQMLQSDKALTKARDAHTAAGPRDKELAQADLELAQAHKRLTQLAQLNEQLVQDRLDQFKMDRLAQKQEDIARQVAELLARKPGPDVDRELARLLAEQQKLVQELEQLAQKSRVFREALDAMRKDPARLPEQAMQLAQKQRELNKEMSPDGADADRLAHLAKQQMAIAQRAAELARQIADTKRPARVGPLTADPGKRAAETLKLGELAETLGLQDAFLENLARVEEDLSSQIPLPANSREAALELAKSQEALKKRLIKLGEDFPRLKEEEVVRTLQTLEKEQRALGNLTRRLDVGKKTELTKQRDAAADLAEGAAERLKRGDALQALDRMEEALKALRQFAEQLPPAKIDDVPASTPEIKSSQEQAIRVRKLAQEQRLLRAEVAKLAAAPPPSPAAHAKQEKLMEHAAKLQKDLLEFAQNTKDPKANAMAKGAGETLEKATEAMKQAEKDAKTRDEAAKLLEKAATEVEQAMKFAGPEKPASLEQELGAALKKGKDEAGEAKAHMQKASPQKAQPSMQQAADALQQAANLAEKKLQNLQNALKPGRDPALRGKASGVPASLLPKEFEKLAGRPWGDLPGELQTRIIQDARARYGDDYARIIQGYFLRLADPKK